MTSVRKVIPKACDACRRRKVKCNGQQPCSGCTSANITCAYVSPRKQGGNRGARATVLNELRANQAQQGAPISPASSDSTNSPLISTHAAEDSFVQECIDAYLCRIRSVVPILTPQALETEVRLAKTSVQSLQFVLAFCAYVANFGNVLEETRPGHRTGRQCLTNALRAQTVRNSDPTPRSMFISFFLYGAHAGLGDYQQGWFYLREATTLFTMLKKDTVTWYDERTHSSVFWILLISER